MDVEQNMQTEALDAETSEESENNEVVETEQTETNEFTYQIENPSWEYYCSDEVAETENISFASTSNTENVKSEQTYDTKQDGVDYSSVDILIKAGKVEEAQQVLDGYSERTAEWHYLQAVIYYKKNWGNECKKQMEIALTKDPNNAKYKDSYDKLCKEMEFKNKNFTLNSDIVYFLIKWQYCCLDS